MKNKQLLYESMLGTILVYLVLWVLFFVINISFKPFNYISNTIKDINLNDLYFSSVANNTVDTNIVIINIEDIDRGEIADLINKLGEAEPAVIGVDVFFSVHNQTEYDNYLRNTINNYSDILVFSRAFDENSELNPNYWHFDSYHNSGHAGILTNKANTAVVREFNTFIEHNNRKIWAYAVEVAGKFSKESFEILKERSNKREVINYIGNIDAFRAVNYSEILNNSDNELNYFKDKIVLIGFYGGKTKTTADLDDLFYSPVGFEITSNRRPDMYGVVIHANIISMIINNEYINKVSNLLVWIVSLLITLIHVWFFTYFFVKKHLYYHVFAKLMQLVSFSLILWIIFILFSQYNYLFSAKYLILPVILSVDVLYLYEALAILVSKKIKGLNSIYTIKH